MTHKRRSYTDGRTPDFARLLREAPQCLGIEYNGSFYRYRQCGYPNCGESFWRKNTERWKPSGIRNLVYCSKACHLLNEKLQIRARSKRYIARLRNGEAQLAVRSVQQGIRALKIVLKGGTWRTAGDRQGLSGERAARLASAALVMAATQLKPVLAVPWIESAQKSPALWLRRLKRLQKR
jgi:hypothetical protein